MSGRRTTLGERMSAVEACIRVLRGAERAPSRAMEREYLADCLAGAMTSLRWLETNGEDARAYVELRRRAREAGAGEAAADSAPNAASRPAAEAEDVAPKQRRRITEMKPGAWAALRCKDVAFRRFLNAADEDVAAQRVRAECGDASRGALDGDEAAAERWRALDAQFRAWLDCAGEDAAE